MPVLTYMALVTNIALLTYITTPAALTLAKNRPHLSYKRPSSPP